MPKIPEVNHLAAVRALEKAGFRIVRARKTHRHVRWNSDPHNPSAQSGEAFTMGGIARDAGLSLDEFKKLL